MNLSVIDQLPMWFSFGLTIVGLIISLFLVRLAQGGVLSTFTILITVGILIFGVHHLIELIFPQQILVSEGLEALSSLIFLIATIYLSFRLNNIIDGP